MSCESSCPVGSARLPLPDDLGSRNNRRSIPVRSRLGETTDRSLTRRDDGDFFIALTKFHGRRSPRDDSNNRRVYERSIGRSLCLRAFYAALDQSIVLRGLRPIDFYSVVGDAYGNSWVTMTIIVGSYARPKRAMSPRRCLETRGSFVVQQQDHEFVGDNNDSNRFIRGIRCDPCTLTPFYSRDFASRWSR